MRPYIPSRQCGESVGLSTDAVWRALVHSARAGARAACLMLGRPPGLHVTVRLAGVPGVLRPATCVRASPVYFVWEEKNETDTTIVI